MNEKQAYSVVKHRHVTEKSRVLENLQHAESNLCLKKCKKPKYVFIVDKKATKTQIAEAVKRIYANKNIKVVGVNTITVKPKKRRVRGRSGLKKGFKKAIVTLEPNDSIDEQV